MRLMLKIVTKDISDFRDTLDAISSLITEAIFKINSNGIGLVAIDPASVGMVVYNMFASAFDTFKVEKEMSLGLNVGQLVSVLKRASAGDEVEFTSDGEKFTVVIKGKSKKKFVMPIIDMRENEQKVPNLEFFVTVDTNVSYLKDAIKDVNMVSDCAMFVSKGGKFIIKAEGDGSEVEIEIPEAKVNGEGTAKYATDYLEKMILKGGNDVRIRYSDDYPVEFEYVVKDKYKLQFILAPRVDTA